VRRVEPVVLEEGVLTVAFDVDQFDFVFEFVLLILVLDAAVYCQLERVQLDYFLVEHLPVLAYVVG